MTVNRITVARACLSDIVSEQSGARVQRDFRSRSRTTNEHSGVSAGVQHQRVQMLQTGDRRVRVCRSCNTNGQRINRAGSVCTEGDHVLTVSNGNSICTRAGGNGVSTGACATSIDGVGTIADGNGVVTSGGGDGNGVVTVAQGDFHHAGGCAAVDDGVVTVASRHDVGLASSQAAIGEAEVTSAAGEGGACGAQRNAGHVQSQTFADCRSVDGVDGGTSQTGQGQAFSTSDGQRSCGSIGQGQGVVAASGIATQAVDRYRLNRANRNRMTGEVHAINRCFAQAQAQAIGGGISFQTKRDIGGRIYIQRQRGASNSVRENRGAAESGRYVNRFYACEDTQVIGTAVRSSANRTQNFETGHVDTGVGGEVGTTNIANSDNVSGAGTSSDRFGCVAVDGHGVGTRAAFEGSFGVVDGDRRFTGAARSVNRSHGSSREITAHACRTGYLDGSQVGHASGRSQRQDVGTSNGQRGQRGVGDVSQGRVSRSGRHVQRRVDVGIAEGAAGFAVDAQRQGLVGRRSQTAVGDRDVARTAANIQGGQSIVVDHSSGEAVGRHGGDYASLGGACVHVVDGHRVVGDTIDRGHHCNTWGFGHTSINHRTAARLHYTVRQVSHVAVSRRAGEDHGRASSYSAAGPTSERTSYSTATGSGSNSGNHRCGCSGRAGRQAGEDCSNLSGRSSTGSGEGQTSNSDRITSRHCSSVEDYARRFGHTGCTADCGNCSSFVSGHSSGNSGAIDNDGTSRVGVSHTTGSGRGRNTSGDVFVHGYRRTTVGDDRATGSSSVVDVRSNNDRAGGGGATNGQGTTVGYTGERCGDACAVGHGGAQASHCAVGQGDRASRFAQGRCANGGNGLSQAAGDGCSSGIADGHVSGGRSGDGGDAGGSNVQAGQASPSSGVSGDCGARGQVCDLDVFDGCANSTGGVDSAGNRDVQGVVTCATIDSIQAAQGNCGASSVVTDEDVVASTAGEGSTAVNASGQGDGLSDEFCWQGSSVGDVGSGSGGSGQSSSGVSFSGCNSSSSSSVVSRGCGFGSVSSVGCSSSGFSSSRSGSGSGSSFLGSSQGSSSNVGGAGSTGDSSSSSGVRSGNSTSVGQRLSGQRSQSSSVRSNNDHSSSISSGSGSGSNDCIRHGFSGDSSSVSGGSGSNVSGTSGNSSGARRLCGFHSKGNCSVSGSTSGNSSCTIGNSSGGCGGSSGSGAVRGQGIVGCVLIDQQLAVCGANSNWVTSGDCGGQSGLVGDHGSVSGGQRGGSGSSVGGSSGGGSGQTSGIDSGGSSVSLHLGGQRGGHCGCVGGSLGVGGSNSDCSICISDGGSGGSDFGSDFWIADADNLVNRVAQVGWIDRGCQRCVVGHGGDEGLGGCQGVRTAVAQHLLGGGQCAGERGCSGDFVVIGDFVGGLCATGDGCHDLVDRQRTVVQQSSVEVQTADVGVMAEQVVVNGVDDVVSIQAGISSFVLCRSGEGCGNSAGVAFSVFNHGFPVSQATWVCRTVEVGNVQLLNLCCVSHLVLLGLTKVITISIFAAPAISRLQPNVPNNGRRH